MLFSSVGGMGDPGFCTGTVLLYSFVVKIRSVFGKKGLFFALSKQKERKRELVRRSFFLCIEGQPWCFVDKRPGVCVV